MKFLSLFFLVGIAFGLGAQATLFKANKKQVDQAMGGGSGNYDPKQCNVKTCGTSYVSFRSCLAEEPKMAKSKKACYEEGLSELVQAYMVLEEHEETGKSVALLKKKLPKESSLRKSDFLASLEKENEEEKALLLIRAVYYVGYEKGGIVDPKELHEKLNLLATLQGDDLSEGLQAKVVEIAKTEASEYIQHMKDSATDMTQGFFSKLMNHSAQQLLEIVKEAESHAAGLDKSGVFQKHIKSAIRALVCNRWTCGKAIPLDIDCAKQTKLVLKKLKGAHPNCAKSALKALNMPGQKGASLLKISFKHDLNKEQQDALMNMLKFDAGLRLQKSKLSVDKQVAGWQKTLNAIVLTPEEEEEEEDDEEEAEEDGEDKDDDDEDEEE